MAERVRVGLFPAALTVSPREPEKMLAVLRQIADAGVDHLCVGDHVSFFVGAGNDGLIDATSLLARQSDLPVYVAVYLLPVRHPVLVARQLATMAELAPGRLTLGVGVGGEDRHEIETCGVDPSTRGRRMDESLRILRGLADGSPVTFDGEFFALDAALIVPAPTPSIPIVVGGRSDAAIDRAASFGDGWLGIWVSPRRYDAVCDHIAQEATLVGRDAGAFEHGLNVWCGFDDSRSVARDLVAAQMQSFYQMPYEPFERYSPYGTPEDVAAFLSPYIDAGCSAFNVIPCAGDDDSAIAAVGELRALLTSEEAAAGVRLVADERERVGPVAAGAPAGEARAR